MRIFLIIVLIVLVLILFGLGFYYYLGGFNALQVQEKEVGPYTIAYINFTGDYKKVSEPMNKLYEDLKKQGINQTMGIGIYYDNPANTTVSQLRSDVGSIIDAKDTDKVTSPYSTKKIDTMKAVVVEFPLKNMFSYIVGVIKVYPIVNKYLQEKKYSTQVERIEIYDMQNNKILYLAPIR